MLPCGRGRPPAQGRRRPPRTFADARAAWAGLQIFTGFTVVLLGEFEQVLLFTLLELAEESDGASIRRHIEKRTGRVVSPGAVYTAMDRMRARGLVSSRVETTPPELGGRRRKIYRLEPGGARALDRSYRLLSQMARGLGGRLTELAAAARKGRGR